MCEILTAISFAPFTVQSDVDGGPPEITHYILPKAGYSPMKILHNFRAAALGCAIAALTSLVIHSVLGRPFSEFRYIGPGDVIE